MGIAGVGWGIEDFGCRYVHDSGVRSEPTLSH